MNLLHLIETSAQQLEQAQVAYGHGTLNAHDEAVWLILWQLKLPIDLLLSKDLKELQQYIDEAGVAIDAHQLSAAQIEACQTLIAKRIESRKPAAYLTQEAWLQGIPFYVDERSIVPRSFIAELIAEGDFDGWFCHPDGVVIIKGNQFFLNGKTLLYNLGILERWYFHPEGFVIKSGNQLLLNGEKLLYEGDFDSWRSHSEGVIVKKGMDFIFYNGEQYE